MSDSPLPDFEAAIRNVPLPTAYRPLLLLADPLGTHSLPRTAAVFREWAVRQWCQRKNGGQPVGGTEAAQQALGTFGHPLEGGEVFTLHGGFWRVILPEFWLQVPKQGNDFDCGLYTVRYAESILHMLWGPWSNGVYPLSKDTLSLTWHPLVPRFSDRDVLDTRRLIKGVVECCRCEAVLDALSIAKTGGDLGDPVLLALVGAHMKEFPRGVGEGQRGWCVQYALYSHARAALSGGTIGPEGGLLLSALT